MHVRMYLGMYVCAYNIRTYAIYYIIILLFIKFAFKRTLLKQINIIKTVLKQYKNSVRTVSKSQQHLGIAFVVECIVIKNGT